MLATKVLSVCHRQSQRVASRLREEKLRMGGSTGTCKVYQLLFQSFVNQNILELHIFYALVFDFLQPSMVVGVLVGVKTVEQLVQILRMDQQIAMEGAQKALF